LRRAVIDEGGRLSCGDAVTRIAALIPPTATRTVPYSLDQTVYRRRNLIERLFGRLENWRRIATRYDRLARKYMAALALVAVTAEWAE
jgi:transposase